MVDIICTKSSVSFFKYSLCSLSLGSTPIEQKSQRLTYEPQHEKTCFMPYANNKGADQPAHPHSLISTFVVHCLDSIIFLTSIFAISLLSLGSVADQAGLSLTWLETPKRQVFS